MSEGQILKDLFPGCLASIAKLRSADPIFDEICRDFLLLNEDYRAMKSGPGTAADSVLNDIRETLDGLQEEITRALLRAGKL